MVGMEGEEEPKQLNFAEVLKLTEEQIVKVQQTMNELQHKSKNSFEFARNIGEWLEKNTPTTNEAYLMGFAHGRRVQEEEIMMKMRAQMLGTLKDLFKPEMKK